MQLGKNELSSLRVAVLNSYSQVFFSTNRVLSVILLVVSFFDYTAGLCGLLSVIVGVVLTQTIGMDQEVIKKGLYGFNNLLVGLGLGLQFQCSAELFAIVVFASLLTSFITLGFQGILGKYALPYLSLPFLFGIWFTLLATRDFSALGLSVRGVYSINEIFDIGGLGLLNLYQKIDQFIPTLISTYFKSLGAIFFQYNVFAGIFISIGLLIFSRIIFSLSLIGYFGALLIYHFFGIEMSTLSYSYIGFNYILTAIALGGYFLLPSTSSYGVVAIILPITILLSFATERILFQFALPAYSLPFNIIVVLFLYTLRFRTHRPEFLKEVIIQQDTPEKNVYLQLNDVNRMRASGVISLALPVMGKWTVNQGYNGKHTHKGEWRHAMDLVITDNGNNEFVNQGLSVEDYYCYAKNITAPADGYVVDIIDGIDDNIIGNVDIKHNWGNSIVIQHVIGLCSQVSHIQKGSIVVHKGDYVQKGQLIAKVGNSGRSPYPHLHFQIQIAPYIGAKTLDYPISNYITDDRKMAHYHAHGTPLQGQKLQNVVSTPLVAEAFNFTPGQELTYHLEFPNGKSKKYLFLNEDYSFIVHSDIYNNTYLECKSTGAKAWFYRDDQIFYFSNYQGNKKTFIYYLMLSILKVELAYSPEIMIQDNIPTHLVFSGFNLFRQDFVAPFHSFLKGQYQMQYKSIDDEMAPQKIELYSKATSCIYMHTKQQYKFDVTISERGLDHLSFKEDEALIFHAKCINNQKI